MKQKKVSRMALLTAMMALAAMVFFSSASIAETTLSGDEMTSGPQAPGGAITAMTKTAPHVEFAVDMTEGNLPPDFVDEITMSADIGTDTVPTILAGNKKIVPSTWNSHDRHVSLQSIDDSPGFW